MKNKIINFLDLGNQPLANSGFSEILAKSDLYYALASYSGKWPSHFRTDNPIMIAISTADTITAVPTLKS